jgi:hypothetical protein
VFRAWVQQINQVLCSKIEEAEAADKAGAFKARSIRCSTNTPAAALATSVTDKMISPSSPRLDKCLNMSEFIA